MAESTCTRAEAQADSSHLFLNIPLEIAQLDLKIRAKLVYGALKMHCRHKDICRVRRETLGQETGLSRASVTRALKDLRTAGLVGTLRTGRSNYYVLYSPSAALDPSPETENVDNPPKAQSGPVYKKNFSEEILCSKDNTNSSLSTEPNLPAQLVFKLLQDEYSTQNAIRSPETATLLPFLTAEVQNGGLGWRLHRGNERRLEGYLSRYGPEKAWRTARHCFDQGKSGGAALWDWLFTRAGFPCLRAEADPYPERGRKPHALRLP